MSQNVNQLFQSAKEEGLLSQTSFNTLTVADIGQDIENALGVRADDIQASEVILLTIMPDDSGSISSAGNIDNVINGHNMIIEALKKAKQSNNILAHTKYLNGQILFDYRLLDQSVLMDKNNYSANQGTPLYDETVKLLGTVIAKSQEFSDNGVPVRTITLIITDGQDEHSKKFSTKHCKAIISDMLKTENHIIAAMGINNGSTNFKQIFNEMGIQDNQILTPGNSEKEIRLAFNLFSQSAIRASQSSKNFSQVSIGGFGA